MFKTLIKPTLILGTIGLISSLTLSYINKLTKPEIEKRLQKKKDEAYAAVLPQQLGYIIVEKDKRVLIDGQEFVYTRAEKKDGERNINAYAFEIAKRGYSGLIRSIVAVDENMKILGLSIIQQTETPGLGARVKEMISKETFFSHFFGNAAETAEQNAQSWFEQQFIGLDCTKQIGILKKGEFSTASEEYKKELLEKNSVSAITGATITTKAVIDSIAEGIEKLKKAIDQEKHSQNAIHKEGKTP
ncbi:MAG: FMN-binding protein [Spirochaetes bacterium]|nr:FMN-binding protein [Spirochaetota bacterium]